MIEKDRAELNIVAPCPHHHKCPMADKSDTWCHFKQTAYKYPKTIFPKHPDEMNQANEKFSYLIVKKGKTPA